LHALQTETFSAEEAGGTPRFYTDLSFEERSKLLRDRLKKYCQKVRTALLLPGHCLNCKL
jgi:DNA polymerase epsilon subunit 1